MKTTLDGTNVTVGAISEQSRQTLASHSPSAADIFAHMGDLNDELLESHDAEFTGGVQEEPVVSEDPLFDNESMLEQRLAALKQAADVERQEAAAAAASEESDVPVQTQEETLHDKIVELLQGSEDAPTAQQIVGLKARYGEHNVNCIALGEGDVYIFVPLTRGQWKKIQEVAASIQGTTAGGNLEEKMKETVIQYSVKWPRAVQSPDFFFVSKAGVIDTLYELILLNSYFLAPQQAMLLTTKL